MTSDAMKEAGIVFAQVRDELDGRGVNHPIETIAAALLAAEKRGAMEERERAAKVAEGHRINGPLYDMSLDCGTWPDALAAAIRIQPEPEAP